MSRSQRPRRRPVDAARRVAYDALRAVHAQDAYANLVLADLLGQRRISGRDAAFATELLHGTARAEGTYALIIEAAAGRRIGTLQPAVVDVLLLGVHQLLGMRVPVHAAVNASVDLAAASIGERVTGLVNAVLRKVAARDRDGWNAVLTEGKGGTEALAIEHDHPGWIVDAFADALAAAGPSDEERASGSPEERVSDRPEQRWLSLSKPTLGPPEELGALLAADNEAPTPTLVVRPGLCTVEDLVAASGGEATVWSPFGVRAAGFPGELELVRSGRAGVQDEGSQLVARALSRVPTPEGPWLDLCAGPGGKSALLLGLARTQGSGLVACEPQRHRARLVAGALAGYSGPNPDKDAPDRESRLLGTPEALVICADGTRPAWQPGSFARVLADVPCSGLGALRRRPEARWRRTPTTVTDLVPLQRSLLHSAIEAAMPPAGDLDGGVVAYVTCSPHVAETDEVVATVLGERGDVVALDATAHLPEMPGIRRRELAPGAFSVQLWPHRHGTDAMYLALLRRT